MNAPLQPISSQVDALPLLDPLGHGQLNALTAGSLLHALVPFASPEYLLSLRHGKTMQWLQLIADLPAVKPGRIDLGGPVRIGDPDDCSDGQLQSLRAALQQLIPWRKGPFELFGIDLDTEWRSDLKWDRLLPHISPLQGRSVLDVGCGSGYHCLRMLGEQARLVIGIEPHLPYLMQFVLLKRYLAQLPGFVLPLPMERLPAGLAAFDTVFSMGVLYHRRSPLDHLMELKGALRHGGELVLETLVAEGGEGYSLTPEDRYCRMSNVWFIPSCDTVRSWLRRCGFRDIHLADVGTTTSLEQRPTEWMPFQSLADGLDAGNPALTIEGLPAPRRAIIVATAP